MINKIVNKINELKNAISRPVRLMEVCGTHTVAIFRHGIRDLLPEGVKLLSGPGCPVCHFDQRWDTIATSRTTML
jgi:hydrogenase expression/formation protein HypD